MNWLNELSVGDMVYIVPADRRFNKPYHAQVSRKARKFIYLAEYHQEDKSRSRHEVKADMTNIDHVMTSVNVGSGSAIYRSFDDYLKALESSRMRRRIEDRFRYAGAGITEDEIRKIAAILNISGDPDE